MKLSSYFNCNLIRRAAIIGISGVWISVSPNYELSSTIPGPATTVVNPPGDSMRITNFRADPVQLIKRIEAARDEDLPDNLLNLIEDLRPLLSSGHRKEKTYAHYYTAYIHYRIQTDYTGHILSAGKMPVDHAISHLEQAIDIDPDFAEGYTLLAQCFGLKAIGIFSRMRYGSRYQSAVQTALQLEPENPRAVLADALGTLHKPAIIGGSESKALELLRKSLKLFESTRSDDPWQPIWGHDEAHAWSGLIHLNRGEYLQAENHFMKALQIRRNFRWVLDELIPRLEKEKNNR